MIDWKVRLSWCWS